MHGRRLWRAADSKTTEYLGQFHTCSTICAKLSLLPRCTFTYASTNSPHLLNTVSFRNLLRWIMPVPFLPSPPASLLPYRLSAVPVPLWVARSHRLASTACPWPPLRAALCVHVFVIVFVVVCLVMMFHLTISCLRASKRVCICTHVSLFLVSDSWGPEDGGYHSACQWWRAHRGRSAPFQNLMRAFGPPYGAQEEEMYVCVTTHPRVNDGFVMHSWQGEWEWSGYKCIYAYINVCWVHVYFCTCTNVSCYRTWNK